MQKEARHGVATQEQTYANQTVGGKLRYSSARNVSETAPPRNRRNSPSEQTDEAPGLIENEQVEVEREIPADENQAIERIEPPDRPEPPVFEE
jgi:hypothetical protein